MAAGRAAISPVAARSTCPPADEAARAAEARAVMPLSYPLTTPASDVTRSEPAAIYCRLRNTGACKKVRRTAAAEPLFQDFFKDSWERSGVQRSSSKTTCAALDADPSY